MNLGERIREGILNPPGEEARLADVARMGNVPLPEDYLAFLRRHDGGEGFVGENYLILWRAEELHEFNREYEVEQYAPGIFLFGSNGGGEGYGFDSRTSAMPVVRIPFVGMDLAHVEPIASSFTDMFDFLEHEFE